MKICALTHTYPRFTNDINAPFVESLMEHISQKNNDVSVLTAYDPEWKRMPGDHSVDLRTYRYIWPESLHILGYSRTIEGNVRFRKRVMFLSPFLFAASYYSFLKLVKEKKPDIIHAHWILPNGFIAAEVSKKTGIPLLIQTHGSDIFTAEKNALFRYMARFAASQARYIVTPSPEHSERLGAIGIDRIKIGLVPNTVELDFSKNVDKTEVLNLKKTLGIPEHGIVILAMGRMVYVKGFSYLLKAFKKILTGNSNVFLVLAGGGVLYEDLKREAENLGIAENVRMPGAAMRSDVPLYFGIADIFVVPSIRHESGAVDGLPVVVPEAMASGLPIVASDLSGIPVLVKDRYNGILVPEKDSDAIACAVGDLIKNGGQRKIFGERSRKIIEKSVNYDFISDYFIRLYHEIAFNKTPPEKMPGFEIQMG